MTEQRPVSLRDLAFVRDVLIPRAWVSGDEVDELVRLRARLDRYFEGLRAPPAPQPVIQPAAPPVAQPNVQPTAQPVAQPTVAQPIEPAVLPLPVDATTQAAPEIPPPQ